jgi:hypothetical protein
MQNQPQRQFVFHANQQPWRAQANKLLGSTAPGISQPRLLWTSTYLVNTVQLGPVHGNLIVDEVALQRVSLKFIGLGRCEDLPCL